MNDATMKRKMPQARYGTPDAPGVPATPKAAPAVSETTAAVTPEVTPVSKVAVTFSDEPFEDPTPVAAAPAEAPKADPAPQTSVPTVAPESVKGPYMSPRTLAEMAAGKASISSY